MALGITYQSVPIYASTKVQSDSPSSKQTHSLYVKWSVSGETENPPVYTIWSNVERA